jgi:membrane protease YdiL (CAAX protease family)
MDVKIPLTKLAVAYLLLVILADCKGNHPDQSALFARQKWTLEDAYHVFFGLINLIFVFKVLLPLWFPDNPPTDSSLYGWMCFVAVLLHREIGQKYGITWGHFGINKTRFFGSGVVALNIALGYSYSLASGVGIPTAFNLATGARPVSQWFDPITIGFGCVFIEELVFRGVLYAPAARRIGKWAAIHVLAFVECLIHVDAGLSQSVAMFVVFVVLYLIYIRTESLLAPVILHIGINVPLWQPTSVVSQQ